MLEQVLVQNPLPTQEINENVEERINLQEALFELEDINVCNRYELQAIEEALANSSTGADWLPAAWMQMCDVHVHGLPDTAATAVSQALLCSSNACHPKWCRMPRCSLEGMCCLFAFTF